jgi:hypothetical protein
MAKSLPVIDRNLAFEKSVELLRKCTSPHGFLASSENIDNYHRVFARDSMILSMAALMLDTDEFVETIKSSLRTLKKYSGKHGEIPSNVDGDSGSVSFGGNVGRVDSNMWFIVGAGEYILRYDDKAFFEEMREMIEKILFLCGAWEFNQKGFVYVPVGGDWADEYVQHGYVLYDQILYYQAWKTWYDLLKKYDPKSPEIDEAEKKISHLFHSIHVNYWLVKKYDKNPYVYLKEMYDRGYRENVEEQAHWCCFLSPTGYGYRFDAFANILSILTGLGFEKQNQAVLRYVRNIAHLKKTGMVPAYDPVIKPSEYEWHALECNYRFSFKNKYFHYHNGGLWPMITGFFAAACVKADRPDYAEKYLDGINRSNQKGQEEKWEFREYLNAKTLRPHGTKFQGWSAGGAIIAQKALEGKKVFVVQGPDISFDPYPS